MLDLEIQVYLILANWMKCNLKNYVESISKTLKLLELKFEDNIDINVLTKATYRNLSFLGLIGKIKDISILSKLPFKYLKSLLLINNDFFNTNIDIFRNASFKNLEILILQHNKINNIEGLTKAPFYELRNLSLEYNSILLKILNQSRDFLLKN